jgi:nicotinate-nucleotide adenylyltransferase
VKKKLSEERYQHTLRVLDKALELGGIFGEDKEKIEKAVLLHDYGKAFDPAMTRRWLSTSAYALDDIMAMNIDLAHGPFGADLARVEFGIEDEDVLNAIRYHTFGRAGMSLLEKIVFLADYIEPGRRFAGADRVRRLAVKDLDEAMKAALEQSIRYVESRGRPLHPLSLEALEYFKRRRIHE